MILFKFLYYISFISASYFVHHVSALSMESIIGGYSAVHHYFKHQAVIFGTANFTTKSYVIGGAVIIHKYYVMSGAQNFINLTSGLYKELRFKIGAGTAKLNRKGLIKIDAEYIFLPDYNPITSVNDIAIIKLENELPLANSRILTTIKLPRAMQDMQGKVGMVSGFGITNLDRLSVIPSMEPERLGITPGELHFGTVEIMNDTLCLLKHPAVTLQKQMCGFMYSQYKDTKAGICTQDNGNPLVINGTVEGLASKPNLDCDDTVTGSIYTRVSAYLPFIEIILAGGLPIGATAHRNLQHLARPITVN